jgi:threonine synthase
MFPLFLTSLTCTTCGAHFTPEDKVLTCGKCGNILDIKYDLAKIQSVVRKESLRTRIRSIWRYRELLPISREGCIVSLGEGITPLQKASNYAGAVKISDLTFKLDYMNPTGSFKDRGTAVTVSNLRELSITSAMDDSSGNAGTSLAAYCGSAGIECTLYVPASIPTEKLIQAKIYGAKIESISGSRTDVARAVEVRSKSPGPYYVSHNLSPFFFEGMKTFAYETAEMWDWKTPDHIVFPVGGGALMAGAWKGFEELMELGWIQHLPHLHCVQSEACMPIVEAYRKGRARIEPVSESETIAGGIRISRPARGGQILQTLLSSHGAAVAVSDGAILKHQRLLAMKEGIFAEPTSCAALAGLEELTSDGVIGRDESVLVPITGFGLKDTINAARSLGLTR